MNEQLTNFVIDTKKPNSEGIVSNFIDIEKARVRAHQRRTKSGKLSQVREYQDKRRKKEMEREDAKERKQGWKELEEVSKRDKKLSEEAYAKQGLQGIRMTRRQKKHAKMKSKREQMRIAKKERLEKLRNAVAKKHGYSYADLQISESALQKLLKQPKRKDTKVVIKKKEKSSLTKDEKELLSTNEKILLENVNTSGSGAYRVIGRYETGLAKRLEKKGLVNIEKRNHMTFAVKKTKQSDSSDLQSFFRSNKIKPFDEKKFVGALKSYNEDLMSGKYRNMSGHQVYLDISKKFQSAGAERLDAGKLAEKVMSNYTALHNRFLVGNKQISSKKNINPIKLQKSRKEYNKLTDKIDLQERKLERLEKKSDLLSDRMYNLASDRDYDERGSTAKVPKEKREKFDRYNAKKKVIDKKFKQELRTLNKLKKQKTRYDKRFGFNL